MRGDSQTPPTNKKFETLAGGWEFLNSVFCFCLQVTAVREDIVVIPTRKFTSRPHPASDGQEHAGGT